MITWINDANAMRWIDHIDGNRLMAAYVKPSGRIVGRVLTLPVSYGKKPQRSGYAYSVICTHSIAKSFTEAKLNVERIYYDKRARRHPQRR